MTAVVLLTRKSKSLMMSKIRDALRLIWWSLPVRIANILKAVKSAAKKPNKDHVELTKNDLEEIFSSKYKAYPQCGFLC